MTHTQILAHEAEIEVVSHYMRSRVIFIMKRKKVVAVGVAVDKFFGDGGARLKCQALYGDDGEECLCRHVGIYSYERSKNSVNTCFRR